jgi:hypothetical protein
MLSQVNIRVKPLAVYRSRMIQTNRNSLQCLADFMSQFLHDFTFRSGNAMNESRVNLLT